MGAPSARLGLDAAAILDDPRDRRETDYFINSSYAQWSAYNLGRLGERHERMRKEVEEASKAAPDLKAELDALLSRLHAAGTSTSAGEPSSDDELMGEMKHTAATAMLASLVEMMVASQGEEMSHIWAGNGSAAPSVFSVSAFLPDPRGSFIPPLWGTLSVEPPLLKWTPPEDATQICGAVEPGEALISWPLTAFVGVHDDADEHERLYLRLLQGEGDDGTLIGFKTVIDLMAFERTLRVAVSSAHAAAAAATSSAGVAATAATVSSAGAATAAAATSAGAAASGATIAGAADAPQPKRQRAESARVRKGQELREALGKVASLFANDKTRQAKEAYAAIDAGPAAKDALARKRSGELRDLLFTFGGLNLTKAVLDRFLGMREVKRLLDNDLLKTHQEMTDAKTATALLQASKRYINEMLDAKVTVTDRPLLTDRY